MRTEKMIVLVSRLINFFSSTWCKIQLKVRREKRKNHLSREEKWCAFKWKEDELKEEEIWDSEDFFFNSFCTFFSRSHLIRVSSTLSSAFLQYYVHKLSSVIVIVSIIKVCNYINISRYVSSVLIVNGMYSFSFYCITTISGGAWIIFYK